jgi:tRNA G46 methylase TrmB
VTNIGNSKPVSSNQVTVHENLDALVTKHLSTANRTPIPDYVHDSFELMTRMLHQTGLPLWLDSFCGTGISTRKLAEQNPDFCVIGVDQSEQRLRAEPPPKPSNCLLIRSDCEALWRLMAKKKVLTQRHTLLYPNPWPKASQLKRRVHGHASFKALLEISPHLELRTNWEIYAHEFAQALTIADRTTELMSFKALEPITRFEAKYSASEHTLWRVRSATSS